MKIGQLCITVIKGREVLTVSTGKLDKSTGARTEGKCSGAFFFAGTISSIHSRNVLLVCRKTSINTNLQTVWLNLVPEVRINIGREYIHVEVIKDVLLQKFDVGYFREVCYDMAKEH